MTQKTGIEGRFQELDNKRTGLLDRARECSRLTIPSILPPNNTDDNDILPTPYQSVGARGVNNLSSKLLMTLLPPNQPFFKLSIGDDKLTDEFKRNRSKLEEGFRNIENKVRNEIDKRKIRASMFRSFKDLIISGNSVIKLTKDELIPYRFDNYVVQRDPSGNVSEIIVKEAIVFQALPEDIQAQIIHENKNQYDDPAEKLRDEIVALYTQCTLQKPGSWKVIQEAEATKVKQINYTDKNFPFLVLRWASDGGHYGRGLIEEYLGDLKSLESLTKSLVDGSILAARWIQMVSASSGIDPEDFASAENGAVFVGTADQVSTVTTEKARDMNWVMQQATVIEQRLVKDFLLVEGIQRDAERVTAHEIQVMSQELEAALGGIYTLFASEFQAEFAKLILKQLEDKNELPPIVSKGWEYLDVQIVTGMEALGRGQEFRKLTMFFQTVAHVPETLQYVNMHEYIKRLAVALNIDEGLVKSEKQLQTEQQAQMEQEIALEQARHQQQQQQPREGE